jgi:phospholipid/cholesterol/gamma-HCH transport system permease protein
MVLRVLRHPRGLRWGDLWATFDQAGTCALGIVGMIAFLVGLIMAFQSSVPLRQFGVDIFVVNLVALAMLRELGPIMTAIVLAGRSGSAFAAEIGTMKVNEEVNALRTMGLDPVGFLVAPRLIAGILVTPLLTIFANLLGVAGGFVVMLAMGYPLAALWRQLVGAVTVDDLLAGLIKAFVFGALVAGIGCLRGLQTKAGASAVGVSTTRAVVSGIFLIVVVDAVFAVVFYAIGF